MTVVRWWSAAAAGLVVVLLLASGSAAQIGDQLSNYTGDNATGYLRPLADAFGGDLNSGLFHSAHIPTNDKYFSVEFRVMAVFFGDDDRTFNATTEGGFTPQQTAEVSTVVGPGEATIITNESGASFAFPGGFDLNSFTLAAPQIRFGSYSGTEGLIRYFALDVGDLELGKVTLFGLGLRHSISQYLGPDFPVDLAGGFFWQRFKLGENTAGGDLISSSALMFGVQASKRYGEGVAFVEPYAGLSIDRHSMEVAFESEALGPAEMIDLEFDTDTTARLTLGVAFRLALMNAHIEYSVAGQNSLSFGLAFGN